MLDIFLFYSFRRFDIVEVNWDEIYFQSMVSFSSNVKRFSCSDEGK